MFFLGKIHGCGCGRKEMAIADMQSARRPAVMPLTTSCTILIPTRARTTRTSKAVTALRDGAARRSRHNKHRARTVPTSETSGPASSSSSGTKATSLWTCCRGLSPVALPVRSLLNSPHHNRHA